MVEYEKKDSIPYGKNGAQNHILSNNVNLCFRKSNSSNNGTDGKSGQIPFVCCILKSWIIHLIIILASAIPTQATETTGLNLSPTLSLGLTDHSSRAEDPETACFVIFEEIRKIATQIGGWTNDEQNGDAESLDIEEGRLGWRGVLPFWLNLIIISAYSCCDWGWARQHGPSENITINYAQASLRGGAGVSGSATK